MSQETMALEDARFGFGENWKDFLSTIDESRIASASASFRTLLGDRDYSGLTMLDVGCGSGLSSLVALRMGMRVRSFDYDAESVACSRELKRRFVPDDSNWIIERGDALDQVYIREQGVFDLVHSWGVLHHTGQMWRALDNIVGCVAPQGLLCIALYNDQEGGSRRWLTVKKLYQRLPAWLRPVLAAACLPKLWGKTVLRDTLRGNPLATWRSYGRNRGMSPWHDVIDWVGGYPFEVAKPEAVFEFCRARGFLLERLRTVGGGHGCNEFVFKKV